MPEISAAARREVQFAKLKDAAVSIKNEVLEMIAKVAERKDRVGSKGF